MSRASPVGEMSLRTSLRIGGWCVLGLVVVAALLNDFLAHVPAGGQLTGPMSAPPSDAYPFGTDILGRDVYSETLHGLWVTMWQASMAMLIVVAAGSLLGALCARLPGFLAAAMRWIVGVFAAIPALLLALLLIGLTSHALAAVAAGLAAAPLSFVRAFDRADVRGNSSHAVFARATGISSGVLLRRDIVSEFNAGIFPILARALAAVTIILSTVSFLGFGTVPPSRDLGLMISAARTGYFDAWWTVLFPALALMLLILSARLAAGLDEGERP
jgi:peptide/nickel transport system permease protein